MTTDNIFGNDILNGDLTTSLVPELGTENILIDTAPTEISLLDPLNQELSLTEPEIISDEINFDNNSFNNTVSSFNNIARFNADPLITANAEEFQVNGIDVNDTSFAPPQSQLQFQGGFGDYDGGDDVPLEIKDTEGNVVETFKLTGEGQATLYRDEEYQYVFFSGTDETTDVDIDSTSNIKFGDYIGDSLEIQTTGSIEGGNIVLNNPDETGLVLKSGIENNNTNNTFTSGYKITDLGNVYVNDINDKGQATGYFYALYENNLGRTSRTSKGFIYNDSGFNVVEQHLWTTIYAINDSGDIVGDFADIQQYPWQNPIPADIRSFYTYEGQSFEPLNGFPYKADRLKDINNLGVVVGYDQVKQDYSTNRIWEDTVIYQEDRRERLFINNDNKAEAINDIGQIIGYSDDTKQSFIYGDGTVTVIEKLPEHRYNIAQDINNLGQVVGHYGIVKTVGGNLSAEAFLYSDGIIQDLGIDAYETGINDNGQIVISSKGSKPFIYQNGVLTNLNSLINSEFRNAGWYLQSAVEINNKGQIIGQAWFQGENRGVILSPPSTPSYINVGNISTFGDTVLLQGNEITLTGNAITTNGGEITFDSATTVNGNLTIDSSVTEESVITDGGDITFTGTLDAASAGSGNLRLQAGTGNILFEDTVGGEATFNNINVLGADIVTATADITSDQVIRINSTGDIVTRNITSDNGRVVLSSEQKSISTLDITSGSEERDNIVLQAGDSVSTRNLSANELGVVRIASGQYLEEDSTVVGDITTESITGKQIRVDSTGNFTTTADALAHDGNVVVNAKQNITAENITATNGNVRLTSEEKSITTKDISTIIPEALTDEEKTRKGNIILEAIEGITTENLNAPESGVVRITSGDIVKNDTETLEDDTVLIGDISTQSITGKAVRAVGTGSFTATGDIIAHDGKITVAVTNDVNTKNINSLANSINLISTEGAVTVDGDLNSEKGGISIHAANDIATQKIRSFDGVVALSSYDGEITIEDDLNAVRGNVTIAAKEGVEVANVTTGVGEVNIGSGKNIVANGNISTNVGYVNLKAGGVLDVKNVTTNDGYISLGADSNVEIQSLATSSGAINLVSATGDVAVAGSINTEGSYVAIEAALEIIASAIEANGGSIDLVANSDFGGVGLIATDPNTTTDVNSTVNENLDNLSPEQGAAFSEIVSDVVYYSRPVGEFLIGALYATVVNNTSEVFEAGQFLLQYPLALTDRDRRYWTQVINNQSTAFKLGVELANAASIVQGIIEIVSGGGTFLGGAALCTVGAGATFGISCTAGAPAMVTGAAVFTHGLSLIKNGIENDTDANLIDDLLAPQKMESTGGSNAARGLAQKIGVNPDRVDRVENALEVLGTKKIEQLEGRLNFTETRFRRDTSGQLVSTKENVKLLDRVLGKSKELVYNISKAFDLVDDKAKGINDVDGINDIRATIKQNRDRNNKPQLINDTELNTALIENNNFIKQYQGRASGAFANRFGKANSSRLNSTEARGELNTAKDILDGNTVLGNDVKLRGLSEKTNTQKNPEYLATMFDGNTRLVEVKTLTGKVERNFNSRLENAISQITGNRTITNPTKNGYIRLDYRQANPTNRQPNWWFEKTKNVLENTDDGNIIPGIDVVEYVEILYKNKANEVKTLLVQVENGIVK